MNATNKLGAAPLRHLLLVVLLLAVTASARAQFGTVIDIPPHDDFGDEAGINTGTQVNVHPSGMIGRSFEVGNPDGSSTNVELNVVGGVVGDELHANGGSVTNVVSGIVGHQMTAFAGSVANISGGTVGDNLTVLGSELNVSGGQVGYDLLADTDSLVNISGGLIYPGLNGGNPDGSSSGVALNISGGFVSANINVWAGSHTTITGGVLGLYFGSGGDSFNARALSFVEVFGGIVDYDFDTFEDADVHFYGNDFLLDGEPLSVGSALEINLGPMNILEGVLEDGTPFALGAPLNDEIAADTLTLHSVPLPPLGATNIMVPPDPPPPSIRDGQTLTLKPGGELNELFRAGRGSTLIVQGGEVGRESQAVGADVSMSSGIIGSGFVALDSTVTVTGGQVFSFFEALDGTVVDISAGSVGTGFRARSGAEVNVSGGAAGGFFILEAGSQVNISGGTFGSNFSANTGSSVNLFGGEFRLDGELIENLDTIGDMVGVNVPEGSVLSGVFQDGTPFAFAKNSSATVSDTIADGSITLHATDVPAASPITFNLPGDESPMFLRSGQTVNVSEGGQLGQNTVDFSAAPGSTVNVLSGFVAGRIEATGATVNFSGGSGNGIRAYGGSEVHLSGGNAGSIQAGSGSVVDVTGGSVFSGIEVYSTATMNISGGLVARFNGRAILADIDSELNISGGTISGRDMFVGFGAVANISGGVFDLFFLAGNGSEINLAGSSFLLDGAPIDDLELGVPLEIVDRDVTLTGTWDNGLPFSFDLASMLTFTTDWFDPTAMLSITLVAPNLLPGDYNDDGVVNAADYVVWRNNNGQEVSLPNDPTPGSVSQADYDAWVANFGATAGRAAKNSLVPEPSSMALVVLTLCTAAAAGRRRAGAAGHEFCPFRQFS